MPARTLVLVVTILAAGCLGSQPAPLLPTDPLSMGPSFALPVSVSLDAPGSEPVIAVTDDGTIFIEGVGARRVGGQANENINKVWRSTDNGRTWQDVTPQGLGQEGSFDGFLATGNGGRVYAVNVAALTFELYRSDDNGATWTPLPAPRVPVAMHRNWIVPVGEATLQVVMEALPPSFLVPGAPSNPNEGLYYFRSDDRGVTWTTPRQIDPIVNFAGQGNLAVDSTGKKLYVVRYADAVDPPTYEAGHWYLLVSEDAGATWERREMFDLTSELASAVMPIAVDPAGTLYFAWSAMKDGTSTLRLTDSKDGGRTWSTPIDVAPGRGAQSMVWIDVRGVGELGVVWYATDTVGSAVKVDADWFVDYAFITGAGTPTPRTDVVRLTPERIHHGNICAKGPACGSDEDRRLLDYPWIDFGTDGRAHTVFASTEWTNPSAFAVYAGEKTPFGLP